MKWVIIGAKEYDEKTSGYKFATEIYVDNIDEEEEALKRAKEMLPGRMIYWVSKVWDNSHDEDHDKMSLLALKMQKRMLDLVEKGGM